MDTKFLSVAPHALGAAVSLGLGQGALAGLIIVGVTVLAVGHYVAGDVAVSVFLVILSYIFGRSVGIAEGVTNPPVPLAQVAQAAQQQAIAAAQATPEQEPPK